MALVSLSSGDYVAIAIGGVSALRWMVDAFFKKADTDEERLIALRLDFEREKAANGEKFIANTTTLARIDRGMSNLQAQFRMLVTGAGNKRLQITDLDENN